MPKTDFLVQTEVNLDKNDVVAVAVAEAEKKIRKTVTRIKMQVKECEDQIKELEEKFSIQGEVFMEKKMAKTFSIFSAKIRAAGYGLYAQISYEVPYDIHGYEDISDFKNRCSFSIWQNEDLKKFCFTVLKNEFPITKAQLTIFDKIQTLAKQKTDLLADGINWKRKQADIPALERQMKAQVARAEMEKTQTGKDVLKSMMDSLEDTIKLIGI